MGFNPDPTDPTDPPPDGDGGGFNFDWLGNIWNSIFGGDSGGGAPKTQPPFDKTLDQVISSTALGGGHQVQYVSHVDGNTYTAFDNNPASGTSQRTLEDAARANNFFRPDGTPDTSAYLAYEAGKHGTAGAAAYKTLSASAAAAGFYNADGTPDTAGYLTYQSSKRGGTTGSKIINLGSGRYLEVGANGQITERTFGGAQGAGGPPSLDPSRSSIVAYLQALLHQNDLPYSGIARGTDAGPAAPAVPAQPQIAPATPAIPASPSFVSPGIGPLASVPSGGGIVGGPGAGGLQIPGITPPIFQPPGVNTPFVPPSLTEPFNPPQLGTPKPLYQPLTVPRSY